MTTFDVHDFDEVVTTLAGRTDGIPRDLGRAERLILVIEAKVEAITAGPKALTRTAKIVDVHELEREVGMRLLNSLRTARSLAAQAASGGPILPGLEGMTDARGVVMDATDQAAVAAGAEGWDAYTPPADAEGSDLPAEGSTDDSGPAAAPSGDPDLGAEVPWTGYDSAKVGEITSHLETYVAEAPLDADRRARLAAVLAYEDAHKGRKTVTDFLTTILSEVDTPPPDATGADGLEDEGPGFDVPDDEDALAGGWEDDDPGRPFEPPAVPDVPEAGDVDALEDVDAEPTVDDFLAAFGGDVEAVEPGELI